jgi:hypothetical protein
MNLIHSFPVALTSRIVLYFSVVPENKKNPTDVVELFVNSQENSKTITLVALFGVIETLINDVELRVVGVDVVARVVAFDVFAVCFARNCWTGVPEGEAMVKELPRFTLPPPDNGDEVSIMKAGFVKAATGIAVNEGYVPVLPTSAVFVAPTANELMKPVAPPVITECSVGL